MKFRGDYLKIFLSVIILTTIFFAYSFLQGKSLRENAAKFPEISEIKEKNISSFKDLSDFFTALAEKNGAAYAYRVLALAELPPNTDLHLLGHIVGDVLYKQQGAKGIQICTQEFRNACSHSIVVGYLMEYGDGSLPEMANICREAPGGKGAYTMCFHGLGHGVLAYTGYDLEKAIRLCETTGTPEYNQREYVECVGGTIMEIIGGGFHDRKLWESQSKKYLVKNDPLSPCDKDFMPEIARPQCYTYLTPNLFKMAGADLGKPGPENYKKAFTFCDALPQNDIADRNACFGGFGKEFVVLANSRDIRRVDQMTDDQLAKIHEWCSLAKNEGGVIACVNTAMSSLFWGGENDVKASIRFCNLAIDEKIKLSCFSALISSVRLFVKNVNYRVGFCDKLPSGFQTICKDRLLR